MEPRMKSGCGNRPAEGPAEPGKPDGAALSKKAQGPQRCPLRVTYICNQSPEDRRASCPEKGALECLVRACEAQGALLSTLLIGDLDFKEMAVLDAFYHAGEADVLVTPPQLPFLSASLTLRNVMALAAPHPSIPDSFDESTRPGP